MHAEFLLQYFFLAENGFTVGIVCVCVKAHFHDSKSTFRIKDLFYVVVDECSAPPSRHLQL